MWRQLNNAVALYSTFNLENSTQIDSLIADINSLSETIFIVFCCLLLIACVTGNVLVLAGFATCRQLQILNNYWIISLSITDIILALLVLPMQINRDLHEGRWILGQFSCDFFISLDVLCCTCSTYHLCLISLDRSLCLYYPTAYMTWRTKTSTIVAIVATWALCALISMIRFMGLQDIQPTSYSCIMTNRTYALLSSILSFYLPLVVIICMYYSIWRKTQSRPRRFVSKNIPTGDSSKMVRLCRIMEYAVPSNAIDNATTCSRNGINMSQGSNIIGTIVSLTTNSKTCTTRTSIKTHLVSDPLEKWRQNWSRLEKMKASEISNSCGNNAFEKCHHFNMSLRQHFQRQEKRTTKVVLLVLIAFIILWTPFFSVNLIHAIHTRDTMLTSQKTWTVVTWMGYCNSAVNPFIYTYFNRTFRRAMLNVIRMTCRERTTMA